MTKEFPSHDFDYIAPYYDRVLRVLLFALGSEPKFREKVAASLKCENLRRGAKILEVGCGTGANLKAIDESYPQCYELVGLDLSGRMLEQARKKKFNSKVDFVWGDATERLPFTDESFAAALAVFSLHEMPEEKRLDAVSEIHRVLQTGGCALVIDISRPQAFPGKILFTLLRAMETKESIGFTKGGPDALFSQFAFRKEKEEPLLLGIAKITLYRKE